MSAIKAAAIALLTALALTTAAKAAERWETLPSFPPMPPAKASGMAPVNDIKMYYAEYGEATLSSSFTAASAAPMSGAIRSRILPGIIG